VRLTRDRVERRKANAEGEVCRMLHTDCTVGEFPQMAERVSVLREVANLAADWLEMDEKLRAFEADEKASEEYYALRAKGAV